MTTLPASGQIVAEGTVATRRRHGTATLAGAGGFAASGTVTTRRQDGMAELTGVGGLAASGQATTRRRHGTGTLAGAGGLAASGTVIPMVSGTAALVGASGIAASGLVTDIWKGIYQDVGGLSLSAAYVASVYARAPAGQGSSRVRIALSLGGGASGLVSTEATVGESWTRISVVRPTSTGSLRVWAEAAPGQRAEFDAVQLEEGGSPSAFLMHPSDGAIGDAFGYTVTRNLDGSGANVWAQGDAVVNTGRPGNGFIDLYSVRGIKAASQAGPTIVGNVRQSTTYNDWSERWAAGNLRGLYDYGVDTYGFAAGDPAGAWIATDPTNGVRVMFGNTQKARYSSTVLLGEVAPGEMNTLLSPGEIRIRVNTQSMLYANATYLSITQPGDPTTYMALSGQQLSFFRNGTQISRFGSDMVLWDPADATSYLQLASSEIRLQVNGARRFAVLPSQTRFGENVTAWSTIRLTINHVSAQIGEANETSPAGTVLFGRNAANQANMRYNPANGRLEFRSGTTTHLYAASDGIYAGSRVRLSSSGLFFIADTVSNALANIKFTDPTGTITRMSISHREEASASYSGMGVTAPSGHFVSMGVGASTPGTQQAVTIISAASNTSNEFDTRGATLQLWAEGTDRRMDFIFRVQADDFVALTLRPTSAFFFGRPTSALGQTATWGDMWRVGNGIPFGVSAFDTNMIEIVPHSWGDGASILFNAYSVGQTNAITASGNTARSHAHGGGSIHAAPAIINYDGNARRWYFAIDQSTSGSRGASAAWTSVLALGAGGATFGAAAVTENQRIRSISHNQTTGSFPLAVVQSNNSTSLMYIRGDGQAWVNQAWTIGSDARLKTDIRPIEDDPVALVKQLQPKRYKRIGRERDADQFGLIAQELRASGGALADLVTESGSSETERVLGLDYTGVTVIQTAALQQLIARVEQLEQWVAAQTA